MHLKRNTVDIYAPSYYDDFKCKADKCRHSCCIDWEIRIDEKTLERYKHIEDIYRTVDECDGDTCFKLTGEGRCPHLNDRGLCNIIATYGEEYLSQICRNHPRFFNRVTCDRSEAGLGMVCEEACRLILECGEPFSLSLTASENADGEGSAELFGDFDRLGARDRVISVIESSCGFFDAVNELRVELEIPEVHTEEEWLDRFLELEMLDTVWAEMLRTVKNRKFGSEQSAARCEYTDGKWDIYYKRLLTYLVYRHVSMAESYDNFRARLGFAILSAEMIRLIFESEEGGTLDRLAEIARLYSAEIEYSEDNTAELIFEFESEI